jgi:hypothetical protein
MRKTIKILWNGLLNAYDGAFTIVLSNLFFAFLLTPATLFPPVLLITLPLGVAGLYYTNFQLASGESVDWKTFFEGVKLHWWAGLRWTIVNLVVLFSLTFYFFMFIDRSEIWSAGITGLSLGIMAVWVLLQFITFPMMLKQDKPSLLTALRNSLVFLVRWPGFAFAFLFPSVALAIISLFFPPIIIFLSAGLIAFLGSYAVYYKLTELSHPELLRDPRHEQNK